MYLQRTAHQIDEWFVRTGVKPIHEVIMERSYASQWRERTTARVAATLRTDRDRSWWDIVKDCPAFWRRNAGWLHNRTGPPKSADAMFSKPREASGAKHLNPFLTSRSA